MSDLTSLEIGVFVKRWYVRKVDVSLDSKEMVRKIPKISAIFPFFVKKYITYVKFCNLTCTYLSKNLVFEKYEFG